MDKSNSDLSDTLTDVTIGMLSGLTARFIGWPLERIWYLKQESPNITYHQLATQTFSKKNLNILTNTFWRAGLAQSAAHSLGYMGTVNAVIRYNEKNHSDKPNWRVGIEAGIASALPEALVTFAQERKKSVLFSGLKLHKNTSDQRTILSLPRYHSLKKHHGK